MATRAEHATKMWLILTKHAKKRQTLNYGTLYDLLGKGAPPPHALGTFVEYIRRYCKAKGLPPLDRILVSTSAGKADETEEAVFDFDWDGIVPPTARQLDAAFRGR